MTTLTVSRRDFLKVISVAGGGLMLGFRLPTGEEGPAPELFEPNAFLRITPEGIVTVIYGRAEMGQGSSTAGPARSSGVVAFGAALVPILFAYGGWQQTNFVAEEMRDPRRTLPLALVAGTAMVVIVYVLINVAYLSTLGLAGLAATMTPAADVAARALGSAGEQFVGLAIAVSTFGFLDVCILASIRVYYAMAVDGLFSSTASGACIRGSERPWRPSASRARGPACLPCRARTHNCSTTWCLPTGSSSACRGLGVAYSGARCGVPEVRLDPPPAGTPPFTLRLASGPFRAA